MIEAKPIIKDRFWIFEDNGQKIGTLSLDDNRYVFTSNKEIVFFDNKKQIKKKLGIDINWGSVSQSNTSNYTVHNFPTSVLPSNTMYDVKRKLPLFTKSDKSKSVYCAGYYLIKFDKGWVKSFCPKLITIEKYPFKGPYKTESEMRQEMLDAI